jgi:predicted ester cyclase
MSEQNKALARKVFEDVQTQGNMSVVDEIVTADYVGHTPLMEINGPEQAKQFDAVLRSGFSDYKVIVEDQIAEGDKVATRWTMRGTHDGEFQGMAPTGREVQISGLTIFRIANGKLVEGWSIPDLLGLMQQLGAIPSPG